MNQILSVYLVLIVLPLFLGALLRLAAGRRKYAWLVTLAALLSAAVLTAYASTNPIPGSEGPGLRAVQAVCLFTGTLASGCVLRLKRK